MSDKSPKSTRSKAINIVILGSGDAGKSTILKQLSLKYKDKVEPTTQQIDSLKDTILQSAKQLIGLADKSGINFASSEKFSQAAELTAELAEIVTGYSSNEEFLKFLNTNGDKLNLQGGTAGIEYLFKSATRIVATGYKPTNDDLFWARRKTTGSEKIQHVLPLSNYDATFIDIGGQRSERKKWPKIFEHVSVVLYVTALNEYDLTLEEKPTTNRLHESLRIWKKLTSSEHFKKCIFVLIFNKADIFKKKITTTPLSSVFQNYDEFAKSRSSESEVDQGFHYIEDLFKQRFGGERKFSSFMLNSTDTPNFLEVWDKIHDSFIKELKEVDKK